MLPRKGLNNIAQGNALGKIGDKNLRLFHRGCSRGGKDETSGDESSVPRALPWAILLCPCGAIFLYQPHGAKALTKKCPTIRFA